MKWSTTWVKTIFFFGENPCFPLFNIYAFGFPEFMITAVKPQYLLAWQPPIPPVRCLSHLKRKMLSEVTAHLHHPGESTLQLPDFLEVDLMLKLLHWIWGSVAAHAGALILKWRAWCGILTMTANLKTAHFVNHCTKTMSPPVCFWIRWKQNNKEKCLLRGLMLTIIPIFDNTPPPQYAMYNPPTKNRIREIRRLGVAWQLVLKD